MAHYSFMYIDFCDRETWEAFVASDDAAAVEYARRTAYYREKEFRARYAHLNFRVRSHKRWYRARKVYNWTTDTLIYSTDN